MTDARFVSLVLSVSASLVLPGCSGAPTSPAVRDMAGTSPFTGDLQANQIRLTITPGTLASGTERTQCFTAHLPNSTPMNVVQIDSTLNASHHIIFYRESANATDAPLADCQPLNINPFVNQDKVPLFIGETDTATLRLPPGVAYPFIANAPYTLELHQLNATTGPTDPAGEIILTLAPAGSQPIIADMLFWGSVKEFDKVYPPGTMKGLPPHQTTTLSPAGFHWPPDGINLFGLTSHQHHLGIDFTIAKSTGVNDLGTQLFENKDWQHPPLLRFPDNQLLTFDPAKGEGLRWTCTYNNDGNSYVQFGESALTNEMCFLWGYYYPSKGFNVYFTF